MLSMDPRTGEDMNGVLRRAGNDMGDVFTPILTFPPQGGREGKCWEWVAAYAWTREGRVATATRFLDSGSLRSE